VSVDGYFRSPSGDMGWRTRTTTIRSSRNFHREKMPIAEAAGLRRTTYEMMASFWPADRGRKAVSVWRKQNEQPSEGRVLENTEKRRPGNNTKGT